jgi:hypothetical protein
MTKYYQANASVNNTPHTFVISEDPLAWEARNKAHREQNVFASRGNRLTVFSYREITQEDFSAYRNVLNYGKPSSPERLAQRSIVFADADWRDPIFAPTAAIDSSVTAALGGSAEEEDQ